MTGVMLFVRLAVSLAIVIGLMWLAGRVMRSRGLTGTSRRLPKSSRLEVLDRKNLTKTTSVALVSCGSRTLLVGVTEHGISNLADLTPDLLSVDLVDDDLDGELDDSTEREDDQNHSLLHRANGPARLERTARASLDAGAVPTGTAWKTLVDQLRDKTVRRV